MTDSKKKSAAELLAELNRVRALLATRATAQKDDDIPLLDDVVGADEETATASGAEMAAEAPVMATPPAAEPIAPPPLPSEEELEELIDQIIDREMPRIRLELKRVLRDELRMRNLLK